MKYEEALAWLRGERSTNNLILNDFEQTRPEAWVNIARADAGMIEQAYWIVKAHKEGLVPDGRYGKVYGISDNGLYPLEEMIAEGVLYPI